MSGHRDESQPALALCTHGLEGDVSLCSQGLSVVVPCHGHVVPREEPEFSVGVKTMVIEPDDTLCRRKTSQASRGAARAKAWRREVWRYLAEMWVLRLSGLVASAFAC